MIKEESEQMNESTTSTHHSRATSSCCVFFFFSSRRRHTRFKCDWSSDVCSSDLSPPLFLDTGGLDGRQAHTRRHIDRLKKKVAKLEARRDRFALGEDRKSVV